MTKVTIERGIAFFEDGTEVSNVSVQLIKAAPMLLKALKEYVELDTGRLEFGPQVIDQAERAINEAIKEQ